MTKFYILLRHLFILKIRHNYCDLNSLARVSAADIKTVNLKLKNLEQSVVIIYVEALTYDIQ